MPQDPTKRQPPSSLTPLSEGGPENAMELAWEVMKREYPEATAKSKLKPMGVISRLLSGGSAALTSPLGNIYYNPKSVSSDQPTNEDMLAHELTHTQQALRGWPKSLITTPLTNITHTYYENPLEREAFTAQYKRKAGRRDIDLPSDK